jgi:Mannosyltransferase (PIG-V)
VTPPSEATTPTVWRALWTSRLVILVAGIAGVIQIGIPAGAKAAYDPAGLTTPFGYLANAVVAPLARWDSVWYLTIAKSGYAGNVARMAFFPLYPALIHVVGFVTRSNLVAGVLISLVAFAVGLGLLHRLVRLDFGPEVAGLTVMLVAFCPMSFFFSAVYTESLFLAFSVGAIYAARCERWWLAGILGGLAAMSRNGGIALLVPVAVMYLYGPRTTARARPTRWSAEQLTGLRLLLPRYRLRLDVLWLLLIPAGLGAYLAYLGIKYGHALAPFNAEAAWYRHTTFPLTTVGRAAAQAWNGLRQLVHGPTPPYYVSAYAQSAISAALQDIYLFLFLVLGVVALIGGARRLPIAYSLYTLAMLVLALADPVSLQPLASLPRYELVVFPLFIWGAQFLTRHRLQVPALAALAVLLGLFTVEFATWRWVA